MDHIQLFRYYKSSKIIVILGLSLLVIPMILFFPTSDHDSCDSTEDKKIESFKSEIFSGTRAGTLLNLKLKNSESLTIKSHEAYRNVTVRDYATLIVENGELEINGTLTVQNNARFFVINSTVTISPPSLPDNVIIVNISNDATLQIRDSTFITNAQPSHANISYLLSDDSTSVTIDNSKLIAHLPSIPNLSIYLTPPTAGTFILTGETNWNIIDSYLEGHLSYNESDYLTGRWFWLTLQSKASLKLKNTNLWVNEETQPIIKPVSGHLVIEDCEIKTGVIDAEVVSNLNIKNLTISHLNIRDQSKAVVYDSNILENLDIGSAAIFSPVESEGSEPEAIAHIYNSTITNSIFISGNATGYIQNCIFNDCSINNNGSASIANSTLTRVIAYDSGELDIEHSISKQIFIEKESKLYINSPIQDIEWVRSGYNCSSKITINNANIDKLEIWPGDNFGPYSIDPLDYGAGYNKDLNVSNIYINLINSNINTIRTYDDEIVTFELVNSEIKDFIITQFKFETISFTIIDIDSSYMLPDLKKFPDAELIIQYKLIVNIQLNNKPINGLVEVQNEDYEINIINRTNKNGQATFNLVHEIISSSGSTYIEDYSYKVTYYGLQEESQIRLIHTQELFINLTDTTPPLITNIEYGPKTWNLEKDVTVKVTVNDEDVQSIANVTLYYTRDDGNTWQSISMQEVEQGHYETEIPKQDWGDEIEFYIVAYDILGNKAQTRPKSYSVAEEEFNMLLIVFLAIIILFIIGVLKAVFNARKIKKYMNQKTSIKIKEAK
jgi:hypothetical protein